MGFRIPGVISVTAVNALPANATETVIFQIGPMICPTDSAAVFLAWSLNLGTGAGVTSLKYNLRRGLTVSDPLVTAASWSVPASPGNNYNTSGVYFDVLASQACYYCLTVQQIGASVAGTFLMGSLLGYIL